MPTFDFSTPEDEPAIFKFGKGKDIVEMDLTFIPAQIAYDFVTCVRANREKVNSGQMKQIESMAEAIAIVSIGVTTPHSIDTEWVLKNVKLGPLAKAFSKIYEYASGDSITGKNEESPQ